MTAAPPGRVALVTGAAHGIGTAIARMLRDEGATVHQVDRAGSGNDGPGNDGVESVDVSDPDAVAALVARIGPVDVLVNNAGGVCGQTGQPLEHVTDDDWRAVVDANLTTTFVCTRAVAPGMKQAGWGRIVNISSGAGRSVSLTGIQAYATAKAGQIGLTRQTAHELGPFGITVNCVAPGFVLSNPTTQKQWESYGEAGQAALVGGIAVRRLGTPADIANGVRFFVSEASSWVTGQTLSVDGGHAIF
jgi:3-oxoacyl-[acyl-carrier protein] reductase